jgi:hypothetical protein
MAFAAARFFARMSPVVLLLLSSPLEGEGPKGYPGVRGRARAGCQVLGGVLERQTDAHAEPGIGGHACGANPFPPYGFC